LLHGFTLNAFSWNELIPRISHQREVLAYDQIPYGLSDKPLSEQRGQGARLYTLDAAVERLTALLDKLQIERSILVGNSSGGAIALAAAHRHPSRIKALVLINPMATVERMTLPKWLGYSPPVRRLNLLAARWLGSGTTLLEASYHDPGKISKQRRQLALLHSQVAGWDLAWAEVFNRALVEPLEVEQAVAALELPTLVVIGAQDAIIDPQESRRLAGKLSRADIAVIEGCGHLPHEECPQKTYTHIREWIDSLGASSGQR
jgi:pimeloyl-ACP methyl ester carboxylesterase